MDKTFYITLDSKFKNIAYKKVNILNEALIRDYSCLSDWPVYYLIEDSLENKDILLLEILKGNIDLLAKETFDADRLIGNIFYSIENGGYW